MFLLIFNSDIKPLQGFIACRDHLPPVVTGDYSYIAGFAEVLTNIHLKHNSCLGE